MLRDNGHHKVAKGIPPHTSLLKEMKIVCEEIKQVLPAIDAITEKTIKFIFYHFMVSTKYWRIRRLAQALLLEKD
jgi:hypothetical protein